MEEVPFSAKQLMERWLRKCADNNEWHAAIFDKDTGKRLHHVSAVDMCHRKSIYERARLSPSKPKPLGLFEMGRAFEERLESALIEEHGARFVRNNLPVREEHDEFVLVGETDPVVYTWNMRPVRLYEAKSNGLGEKAKTADHQRKQGSWYADVLGFPEVRVVHADRADILNAPEEDTIIRGPEIRALAEAARIYFRKLNAVVKDAELGKTLPEPKPIRDGECRYCEFKDRCVQDGGWVEVDHTVTRGPNKGQVRKEWRLASEVAVQTAEQTVDGAL